MKKFVAALCVAAIALVAFVGGRLLAPKAEPEVKATEAASDVWAAEAPVQPPRPLSRKQLLEKLRDTRWEYRLGNVKFPVRFHWDGKSLGEGVLLSMEAGGVAHECHAAFGGGGEKQLAFDVPKASPFSFLKRGGILCNIEEEPWAIRPLDYFGPEGAEPGGVFKPLQK